jgi:hypothetical protein
MVPILTNKLRTLDVDSHIRMTVDLNPSPRCQEKYYYISIVLIPLSNLRLTATIGVKPMSIAILDAFIHLLEEKPATIDDHHDLYAQALQWSDDTDDLADRVAEYCQARPELYETIKSLLNPGETTKLPGMGNSAPAPKPDDYKDTLLNTMNRVYGTPAPSQKPQS